MTPLTHRPAGSPPPAQKDAHRRAMRILRPPNPNKPPAAAAPAPLLPAGAGAGRPSSRIRLANGHIHRGELPAARHRALHLGLLHTDTRELVELTPGTRHHDGRLTVDRAAIPATTTPAAPPATPPGSTTCSPTPSGY